MFTSNQPCFLSLFYLVIVDLSSGNHELPYIKRQILTLEENKFGSTYSPRTNKLKISEQPV